jgi:uncharacterized protein YecA (UPF0149 family)
VTQPEGDDVTEAQPKETKSQTNARRMFRLAALATGQRTPAMDAGEVYAPGELAPRPIIARNAPCVCGSGMKYKKCCRDKHTDPQPVEIPGDHPRPSPGTTIYTMPPAAPVE